MECNKEEAVRARDLAERKLNEKDYTGAHKVALKARQLYPDLENLNQIITVCEVHCSASTKVNGETDWYGILQVGITADEVVIKKAYRKLALLLHPDKNKFAGAEAAFKLIGEANGILTDKGKRSLHDMKRNARASHAQIRRGPPPAARATHVSTGNAAFTGSNQAGSNQTFWTACHSCGMRYQYYMSILKKALRCQNCLKPFIAYDADEHAKPSGTSNGANPNPNLRFNPFNGPSGDPFQKVSTPFCNQFQGGSGSASTAAGATADVNGKFERVNLGNSYQGGGPKPGPGMGTGTAAAKSNTPNIPPAKSNKRKRKGKVVLEDEEEFEESTDDSEDEMILERPVRPNGTNSPPRRSSRQKQNVSYNEKADDNDDLDDYDDVDDGEDDGDVENGEDDNDLEARKKKQSRNDSKEAEVESNGKEEEADPSLEPKEFTYSDPEFFQFHKIRDQTKFAVDQVWAVYDDRDGMPRFYARIKSVRASPQFQMRYIWLEADPDQSAVAWSRAGLPISFGTFKLGKPELTNEVLMFSHVVPCGKGGKRNTFDIYPKKGEIWAMYKNWDISWSSKSGEGREFEYEMVEVVSDFTDSTGFVVIPLVKTNGFVSLFMQSEEAAPVVIPTSEILRFSHNVPHYRTTGNERDGVPEGAFELDPASLPVDLDKAFPSIDLNPKPKQKSNINSSSAHKDEKREETEDHAMDQDRDKAEISPAHKAEKREETDHHAEDQGRDREEFSRAHKEGKREEAEDHAGDQHRDREEISPAAYEYPDSEFYCFANDRSIENFDPGQIWALYSDIDKFPKYYAQVKRIEQKEQKVYIRWLEPYGEGAVGEEKRWIGLELPLGCGTFRVGGSILSYDNTDAFSHKVGTRQIPGKKNVFEIMPANTEIWAVYSNWTLGWSMNDVTDNCQYDLVRISEVTSTYIRVLILAKVAGYRAVFRLDSKKKPMEIPNREFMRFSHRIPAHRLTHEAGDALKGFWELDPASLPESLLY